MTTRGNTSRAPPASSSVRRNLFHHHLGRRPTSASTSTSATTLQASPEDNSADIVIRDKNGNYQVDIPLVPAVGEELGLEEDVKERESTRFDTVEDLEEDSADRNIGVEARLIELYKNRTRLPTEPAGKQ